MNIHEHQAKQILKKYGATVPEGVFALSVDELVEKAKSLNTKKYVLKAQIHAGGRGKAGGVKILDTIEELNEAAKEMMGKTLVTHQTGPEGREVKRLYVEESSNIDKEFYLSCLVDRASSKIAFISSDQGGMDIEEVASSTPEKIITTKVDINNEISDKDCEEIVKIFSLSDSSKIQAISHLDLPDSWKDYFKGIGDELNIVAKEINGPSWGPKNDKIDIDELQKKIDQEDHNSNRDVSVSSDTNLSSSVSNEDSIKAVSMIRSYRQRGHLIAKLDPLGLLKSDYLDELHPDSFGFKKGDYQKNIYLGGVINKQSSNIKEILGFLKKTYCGPVGYEYMHISNPIERKWFRDRIEKSKDNLNFTKNGKEAILNKLIQAEGFEKFLHTKYVGTKRFGLDGGESLIPALEQIIKISGQSQVKEVKIGMSHRGRLNVLANVLQKSYKRIFNEFAGEFGNSSEEGAGDVKYHLGASSNREFDGNSVHVSLTDNPSHLEAVNPVVLGQTRAKQYFHKDKERNKVIPILIHGDAAFAGQGVVAECFAMSGLPGHNTGGTIHIIVNNQIGFTTSPRFARSSPYPSDVAKMVDAPIIHANGDDPEAVVYAARIATEFRLKFNRDVVSGSDLL